MKKLFHVQVELSEWELAIAIVLILAVVGFAIYGMIVGGR